MKWFQVTGLIVFLITLNVQGQPAAFTELTSNNPAFFTAKDSRGVSIADYDNDGDDDLFIAANPCKLFRNNGDFTFSEVSLASGISVAGKLALWLDVNDDGWLDLLVSGYNQLKLFRNNGNGAFTEDPVTGFTGTTAQVALVAGDLNGDGWLDVYANNFKLDNQLYINYGNYQFRNQIAGSGADVNDQSMGSVLYDFEQDGDLDLYITMDGYRPNKLFINDGTGNFQDTAPLHNLNIRTQGMGVDLADFNRDGAWDLYVSNLFDNSLLMNDGTNFFSDQAKAAGVNDYGMGWGVTCFDYNNDGLPDVYINNEFNFSPYPNRLYRNNGDGSFTDVAAGTALTNRRSGFGCATSDLNSDGLPDLVVVNNGDLAIRIFRNQEQNTNNWISLNLVGTTANKFAAGTHVDLYAGGVVYKDVVRVGSGWYSQNSYRIHVGLGDTGKIDSLVIRWPDRVMETYYDVLPNQRYMAVQHEHLMTFNPIDYRHALVRPTQLIPSAELPDPPLEFESTFSVARIWNEALLEAIRNDFARPTVHARNLFQVSAAMYDAWAAFEPGTPTYFLGKRIHQFDFPFTPVTLPDDKLQARNEAITFSAYRLISHRFRNSPGASITQGMLSKLMLTLGYNANLESLDYSTGEPYALGNYIASLMISYGLQDGSNEQEDYANLFYTAFNPPLNPAEPGNPAVIDPNRWQPLKLVRFIDQSGNEIGEVPPFLSPEWGRVRPFALQDKDLSIRRRDGHEYWLYHDPGKPPLLDTVKTTPLSEEFKKSFMMVSIWSSHLDPNNDEVIDISPASIGNIQHFPTSFINHLDFYKIKEGGDRGTGHTINPKTGLPYAKQFVPRGDYTRVLAEFWADGPKSETPPGHWYYILNRVSYHPAFERKYKGTGESIDPLEWDVKAYITLGGAMHDVAVSVWGIKGYYDYPRPLSVLRYMADRGQSSDPALPNYHPAGLPIIPGYSEIISADDPLAGINGEHSGKVKLYSWRGPDYIRDPKTDMAGVGWILAENWWPYQRPTFVTPPFAGYLSGHSTFSSAAAEVLTKITGDPFFPGGIGEFSFRKNDYLVFEQGPSVDMRLQWATYRDAADQCSLSRIWGGIHPPIDDFFGRIIGRQIGHDAFELADRIFNGYSFPETEDTDVLLYPNPVSQTEELTILATTEIQKVVIIDIMGRLIGFPNPISRSVNSWRIQLPFLASGTYMIQTYTSTGKRLSRKLIIH
jgi:hypothetical protein